ncbi:efflux RND transporter permease subunit [Teredinibacter purpureus]|uniref:efflux RND transporter permease subunit n=1 Tax=Teredinibacter purpureus TaxID=2731756 RepID=UPI000B0B891F|nr:efflux RND transporter permease subunit [Teredinibacter purpureus]
MMKLTEYTMTKTTISWLVVVLLIGGGFLSFMALGRLEDPAFTLKQAVVVTRYPGASSQEVEEEVTLPIENAIQQLPYVYRVVSNSTAGLSQVEVEMKSIYRKDDLAQIWDEMRRKINDLESSLPPGAVKPIINDDFGDVYGIFYAITGAGFSYRELADYADYVRRELVLVKGVGKVSVGGNVPERIYIEVDRAKLSASGFSINAIAQLIQDQSLVTDAGHIEVASEYLRVASTMFGGEGVDALGSLLLGSYDGNLVYLADVATLSVGYQDPATHLYRFNGAQALTLGVSFSTGVNVVEVGAALEKRLAELEYQRPIGIELNAVYNQSAQVDESVNDFLSGLVLAVVIVIVVLMLTMGWRPGLIMSAILLLTIAGTFIAMRLYHIELHRISLGALIIALGMLVDNAIVITEGIMVGIQRGMSKTEAAIKIVSHTRWPLLGATVIAITAFAPIGLSPDATGEFTGSLFWVLLFSLMLSWLLAITLTPFFCFLLFNESQRKALDPEKPAEEQTSVDPYAGAAYRLYKKLLHLTLHYRWATMGLMLALLLSAGYGFTYVKQAFFPDSSLPVFMVDYWLPEGTSIAATEADVKKLERRVLALEGVKKVTATIGRGAERFMLTYFPEKSYSSYAQLIVEAERYEQVASIMAQVDTLLAAEMPQAFTRFRRPAVGPATTAKIEARIIGPDAAVLRSLGQEIETLFNAEPTAINIRQDWRGRTKVLQPVFDSAAAKRFGITKADLDNALKTTLNGTVVGAFRKGSDIVPIVLRPPENERSGVEQLEQLQVFSPVTGQYVNVSQFVLGVDLVWEDPIIKRRDRKRTLSVLADPNERSNPFKLLSVLRPAAETIPLPAGYQLEWGGEYEAQQKANEAVFAFLPLGLLVMVVITIFMFNSIKQTLVVWITVPLAFIGVSFGLLVTGAPFSFTAMLAVLSLIGMQIKNGIVLVEEIKRLREELSYSWHRAISDASVSRLRPVSMAAITTILGMLPLVSDVFFMPMAVTIMFGLGFATVLTLFVVPALFALFYGVSE